MHDEAAHPADPERVAVRKEAVELAPVSPELGALAEHLAKRVLHDGDERADAEPAPWLALNTGGGGEVIGVHMSLGHPLEPQLVVADLRDDRVGRTCGDPPRRAVYLEQLSIAAQALEAGSATT